MATAGKAVRLISAQGYVLALTPEHPRADARGYTFEHLIVVEAALGHFLSPKHPIHHHDEVRTNNGPGNLVVCQDRKYHSLLHQRMRALAMCGDANGRKCKRCGTYDRQGEIVTSGRDAYHRDCDAAYARRRKAAVCS